MSSKRKTPADAVQPPLAELRAPQPLPLRSRPWLCLSFVLCSCAGLFFLLSPLAVRLADYGGGGLTPRAALVDGPGPALGKPDVTWGGWDDAGGEQALPIPLQVARKAAPLSLAQPAAELREEPRGVLQRTKTDIAAATRINPDVFAALPRDGFDPAFKSPCWRQPDAELRCLPAFFILGVFQCGHADLVSRLVLHPEVAGVASPFFWDERPSHPFNDYLEKFSRFLPRIESAPSAVTGDTSFATFTYTWTGSQRVNGEWQAEMMTCREECAKNSIGDDVRIECIDTTCYARAAVAYKGPQLTVPQLLAAVYGKYPLKLVVLLRDPVERLHAAFFNYFHYGNKYGYTEAGFSAFAMEMVGFVKQCLQRHSEAACVTSFESLNPVFEGVFYHADQVLKSIYVPFLEGWNDAFPGALLPIRLEDYANGDKFALQGVLKTVVAHLGLSPQDEPAMMAMMEAPVKKEGEKSLRANRGTIEPATLFALREFYAPYNERLAALLGDEKWRWGY